MDTGIKVLDAMTRMPVTITENATIRDCAILMDKHDVGSLLVMDEGTLKGMITERELARKVLSQDLDMRETCVGHLMNRDVVTATPHMDIYEALMQMNNFDIRQMPVVNNKNVVGFVTLKDILKIQPHLFDMIVENYALREENNKPVITRLKGQIETYY